MSVKKIKAKVKTDSRLKNLAGFLDLLVQIDLASQDNSKSIQDDNIIKL